MFSILLKATGIWVVIAIVAIFNGMLRENILVPVVGESPALLLSGFLLAVLVFLVTLVLIPVIGRSDQKPYISIGFFWVALTLLFEFLFGHFVVGKSWVELLQVFNVLKGDLFVLVLFVSAISPWTAAKLRGIL